MSKTLTIEEESGTFSRTWHPHNGYYAGDFSTVPMPLPGGVSGVGRHAIAMVCRPLHA